jgi:hypothetical protein
MPDNPPALEAANEVAGHCHQKLFHAKMVRKTAKRRSGLEELAAHEHKSNTDF